MGNLGGGGGDLPGRDARGGFGNSGPQHERFQRWGPDENRDLDRVILSVGNATAPSASCPFELRAPDVKVRTRVVLAIEQGNTGAAPIDPVSAGPSGVVGANAFALWLAGRQRLFASGFPFLLPPTRNLVGTAGSPLTIPTDARLWGFEVEFETAGEEIYGVLSVSDAAPATRPYRWHLITNFESVDMLTPAEWQKITERAGITRGDLTLTGF